jgi:hypothetical protein|tara:strand:+ start:830 stop:1117 length:288 start_codon:yes stop_codon:yes gene_type:complete
MSEDPTPYRAGERKTRCVVVLTGDSRRQAMAAVAIATAQLDAERELAERNAGDNAGGSASESGSEPSKVAGTPAPQSRSLGFAGDRPSRDGGAGA